MPDYRIESDYGILYQPTNQGEDYMTHSIATDYKRYAIDMPLHIEARILSYETGIAIEFYCQETGQVVDSKCCINPDTNLNTLSWMIRSWTVYYQGLHWSNRVIVSNSDMRSL